METLVKKLIKKKIKVSFAESCTGGMLASSITSVNGASKVFNLGFITYSNQAKIKILKIILKILNLFQNFGGPRGPPRGGPGSPRGPRKPPQSMLQVIHSFIHPFLHSGLKKARWRVTRAHAHWILIMYVKYM